MKWILFSDIHFNPEAAGADTILLKRQLLQYLREEIGNVDWMFLAGDYRYCGQPKEPDEISNWIKEAAGAVGIADMKEKICMVPGNHDLNRNQARKYIVEGVKHDYSAESGMMEYEVMKQLLADFSFFDSLYQNVYGCSYIQESLKNRNPHRLKDCGSFYLLMLNTAFISCNDNERGSLLIGRRDVLRLMPKKRKPVIVLAHHEMDALEREEQKKLRGDLKEWGVKLYLCGDAHLLCEETVNGCCQLTSGCLMKEPGRMDAAFLSGEILNDEIRVRMHEWNHNWAVNMHYGSHGTLSIPWKPGSSDTGNSDDLSKNVWLKALESITYLDRELRCYLADGIADFERRNIPVHTPQALLLLFRYRKNTAYIILNQYRTEDNVPYGEYLCELFERGNLKYIEKGVCFDRGFNYIETFAFQRAEQLRWEKSLVCITENLLIYSILDDEERRTVQEMIRMFGRKEFNEMKKEILKNPTLVDILKCF